MEADMGLGMFAQHFAKTRGDLIAYAIESDYLVWLPSFLNRRGMAGSRLAGTSLGAQCRHREDMINLDRSPM